MKPNTAAALLSRLAGLFLLVVFGAAQLQVMPLFTVLVAEADGGHSVEVCTSRSGVHIVLHHPRAAGVVAPGHTHHGLLSAIVRNDEGGSHPDHEFSFASGSGAAENKNQTAAARAPKSAEAKADFIAGVLSLVLLHRPSPAAGPAAAAWWPPPPADCAWGQTVLLI